MVASSQGFFFLQIGAYCQVEIEVPDSAKDREQGLPEPPAPIYGGIELLRTSDTGPLDSCSPPRVYSALLFFAEKRTPWDSALDTFTEISIL